MNRPVRPGRPTWVVPTTLAVVALIAAFAFAGFGARPVAAQDEVTVSIVDFAFDPSSVEVAAGTVVTFCNDGGAPHTATGDGGEFDTGRLEPGNCGSVTFDAAGTTAYHCEIHPDMNASIAVTGGAEGGEGEDTADAASGGTTTSAALPATGTGSALEQGSTPALVVGLMTLAAVLGLAGVALRRRPAR
jgi:plastocyanin